MRTREFDQDPTRKIIPVELADGMEMHPHVKFLLTREDSPQGISGVAARGRIFDGRRALVLEHLVDELILARANTGTCNQYSHGKVSPF